MLTKIRRPTIQFSGEWLKDRFDLVRWLQKHDDDLSKPGALHLSEFATDTSETTPTPTAGSGTLTTATASVVGQTLGNRFDFTATVTITTNGTGATDIRVTLPFSAAEDTGFGGWRTGAVGLAAVLVGTSLRITFTDGTYPGADGAVLRVSGSYRKA